METAEDLYAEDYNEDLDRGPLEDEAEEVPENAENEDEENQAKEVVKPKRVIRNPQPKLNAETLRGKRGLTALESYFERVKFKGKGHEEKDLSVILKTYEYWCHRLFPKYPFDECIAKIEKLGAKRAVQTHIKKIRLDMIDDDEPKLIDDVVSDEGEDMNEEDIVGDQFDELLNVRPTPVTTELTDEQEEQIRLNREKAEKLRRERKLGASQSLTQDGSEISQTNDVFQESEVGSQVNYDEDVDIRMENNDLPVSQNLTQVSEVGSQDQDVDMTPALSPTEINDLPVSQSPAHDGAGDSQNLTQKSEVRSQENKDQDVDRTSEFSSQESNDLPASQRSKQGEPGTSQNSLILIDIQTDSPVFSSKESNDLPASQTSAQNLTQESKVGSQEDKENESDFDNND